MAQFEGFFKDKYFGKFFKWANQVLRDKIFNQSIVYICLSFEPLKSK